MCRLLMLLEDVCLLEVVEVIVVALIDATFMATCKRSVAKVKRVLMDSMKDHLIPHIVGNLVGEMYATLITCTRLGMPLGSWF
jgi:hypothetical protein